MRFRQAPLLMAMALLLGSSVWCNSPSSSSDAPVATIRVGSETFRVALGTDALVQAAKEAKAGGPARIPNGRIIAGTDVNSGWSWHLDDLEFAEMAIEVCDGKPSDVERAGVSYGGGRFCPWSATVISVEP